MRTTVLIPTYNRARLIGESIDSIMQQTSRPDRVIVVDDGSTEDIGSIVKAYRGQVEYVRKENGGKAAALNFGLSHVDGGLVWFFDDDDLAAPFALQRMTEALAANSECGFSYGAFDTFQVPEGCAPEFSPPVIPPRDKPSLRRALLHACAIFQGGMLIRRECLSAIGGFDEHFIRAQDYELTLRLARRYDGAFTDGVLFHQRIHRATRGSSKVRVVDRNKYRVQLKYDQDIFRNVHATYALTEYLPERVEKLSQRETFTALIERAAIVGRKGLWDLVAIDLEAAINIAAAAGISQLAATERASLSNILDESSAGTSTYAGSARLQDLFRQYQSSTLLKEMRNALASPLRARLLHAVRQRKIHEVLSFGLVFNSVSPRRSAILNDVSLGSLKLVERFKDALLLRSRGSVR